jgi:hypothetical protein
LSFEEFAGLTFVILAEKLHPHDGEDEDDDPKDKHEVS